jgi:hypothetical protein
MDGLNRLALAAALLIGQAAAAAGSCPQGTEQSGEMCIYDRGVGAPPLTCPKSTVQRGVLCYAPPPAGWGWTTPGGILVGLMCPAGTNDSGTSCWYDRGAGKIPSFGPCPSGYRTDPATCMRDAHIIGKMRSVGWNGRCRPDENSRCEGICGTSLVSCMLKQCPAGYQDDGLTCRRDPHAVGRAQQCAAGHELAAGLCYPRPRQGFRCSATNCSQSKNVREGQKLGALQTKCPADKELSEGLCYPKNRQGFECTLTRCWAYLAQL